MARVGYFDGSSWANAEPFTKTSVTHPRQRPIAAHLQAFIMAFSRVPAEIQSRVT
jgi:hypothetical protein